MAVGVTVSFMFGYPAGMYGASIDLLMTSAGASSYCDSIGVPWRMPPITIPICSIMC